jgi:hypothetical protein
MTISASWGYVIVGIFVASWLLSYAIYRLNRYDEIEVYPGRSNAWFIKPAVTSVVGQSGTFASVEPHASGS